MSDQDDQDRLAEMKDRLAALLAACTPPLNGNQTVCACMAATGQPHAHACPVWQDIVLKEWRQEQDVKHMRAILRATMKGYQAGENTDAKHWRKRAEQAEAEVTRLTQEIARLKAERRRPHRFDCASCGEGVGVDEDGCCRSCGGDTTVAAPSV